VLLHAPGAQRRRAQQDTHGAERVRVGRTRQRLQRLAQRGPGVAVAGALAGQGTRDQAAVGDGVDQDGLFLGGEVTALRKRRLGRQGLEAAEIGFGARFPEGRVPVWE